MRAFFLSIVLFFSCSSWAIYNLKTNTGGRPKADGKKYWLLAAQGCQPCIEILSELKTFCSGKKPPSSRLGFFITGTEPKAMLKKLKDFKADYEIFSGSPNEFYESYGLMGSPSLKAKSKSVSGTSRILKFLKKDSSFCQA